MIHPNMLKGLNAYGDEVTQENVKHGQGFKYFGDIVFFQGWDKGGSLAKCQLSTGEIRYCNPDYMVWLPCHNLTIRRRYQHGMA